MKSIEQCLDEEGFQTWFDNEAGEMVISVEDLKQAMHEYAKQVSIAQREACANEFSPNGGYRHDILNTKLVVD